MVDLSVFWLQMLAITVAMGIAGRLREGWRWNLGGVLQLALLGALCGYGIFLGPADTWVIVVGAALVLVTAWPRVLVGRLQHHMSLLDAASAREEAQRLRLFLWGRPGRFWVDLAQALTLALEHEGAEAQDLLGRYLDPGVPRAFREAARNAQYTMLVLDRAWERILTEFEVYVPDDDSPLPLGMGLAAHRAYLEVGEPAAAVRVLARVDFLGARASTRMITLHRMAFRALLGDVAGVEDLGRALALPLYAGYPWRARALAIAGELEQAQAVLAEAIAAVPPDQPHLPARLAAMAADLPEAPRLADDPEVLRARAEGEAIFARALRQEAVIAPARPSWAVVGLVGAIAAAFVPAHLFKVLPQERWLELADQIIRQASLTAAALHGEWWRLISYQFLHADVFHVGLNLLVLWIFGLQAVEIFGPWLFLALFFATGVAGGVAQLELAPGSPAIGASGAVFGIFGAVIAGIWRSTVLPAPVRKDRVARLLSVAALQFMLDQLFATTIAVFIHAAGMAAGALLGLVAPVKRGP